MAIKMVPQFVKQYVLASSKFSAEIFRNVPHSKA